MVPFFLRARSARKKKGTITWAQRCRLLSTFPFTFLSTFPSTSLPCKVIREKLNWSRNHPFFQIFRCRFKTYRHRFARVVGRRPRSSSKAHQRDKIDKIKKIVDARRPSNFSLQRPRVRVLGSKWNMILLGVRVWVRVMG